MINNIKKRLLALPRNTKRIMMLLFDLVALPLALWSSFAIRTGDFSPHIDTFVYVVPVIVAGSLLAFIRLGLYRAVIRFLGNEAIYAVLKGGTISALLLAAAILLFAREGFPRSVLFIYWLLVVLYVGGSRYLLREFFVSGKKRGDKRKPAIIYGAGTSGHQLSVMLARNTEIKPVCFVDDNKSLIGSHINGLAVHSPDELAVLIDSYSIDQILLALPSADRSRRKAIVDLLEPYSVHVFTIPAVEDIVSGKATVDEIREVDIEDLLGRDSIPPDQNLLHACITDKVVMVTGAGGSIGSELCRQIVALSPQKLILFESSEFALYKIEQELQEKCRHINERVNVVALLGSVQDKNRLKSVMDSFKVQTVYHAAAYKHVPLVEQNMAEGVRNNVFGTLYTAQTAISTNVETFVLISTDKAVRPTNVMGATKRISELILQALSKENNNTTFCMVRFGNVLGSSGSVVPKFREQIHKGGPITVTHPDIVRYFMTIPEAAQLVIQAGSLATGGDVFVLDMGSPVRIADLARKMVRLMGLTMQDEETPGGDIKINYTGLRPGEKLYEELLIGDNVTGTEHRKIMRAEEESYAWSEVDQLLMKLEHAIKSSDYSELRKIMLGAINGYAPNGPIVDHLDTDTLHVDVSEPLH